MDINEINRNLAKLEVKKEQVIGEISNLDKEIEELEPEIMDKFGTTDPDQLKIIQQKNNEELQKMESDIEEKMSALNL